MLHVFWPRPSAGVLSMCIVVCCVRDACSSDLSASFGEDLSGDFSHIPRNRFQASIFDGPHGNLSSKSFHYIVKGSAKVESSFSEAAGNNSLRHRDIRRDGAPPGSVDHLSQSRNLNPQQVSSFQSLKFPLRMNDIFVSPGIRSSRLSRLHSKFLKPYVKYPSPFPEDNSFQTYSGSSRQPDDHLHALLNNSYPYPVSSESHFESYPYQRHPFKAQEDAKEEDSSNMDFPGLFGAPPIQYSSLSGPSFVPDSKEDYYAVAGATAILTCTIRNLHNYTVSWVRGSDIRLLTTGLITYTSDKRFVPSNPARGQDWLLKIHYSRKQDAGAYLCQVSLSPPITKTLYLHVNEAEVHIVPGREVHVQLGSTLHLECHVRGCTHPVPGWRHEGRSLPPSETGGFLVEEAPQIGTTNFTHEEENSSVDSKSSPSGAEDGEDKKNKLEKRSGLDEVAVPGEERVPPVQLVRQRNKRDFLETAALNERIQAQKVSTVPQGVHVHFPQEVASLDEELAKKFHNDRGGVEGPEADPTAAVLRVKKSASAAALKKVAEANDDADAQVILTQNLPDGPIGGAGIGLHTSTTAPESPPYTTIVTVTRKGVTPQHSGIYTCTSTCTPPINVTVHVLRGEELAAIHHQNGGCSAHPSLMATTAALTALCVSILLTGTEHKPPACRHKPTVCRHKPPVCQHKPPVCRHMLAQATQGYKRTHDRKVTEHVKEAQSGRKPWQQGKQGSGKRECVQGLTVAGRPSSDALLNKRTQIRQACSRETRLDRTARRSIMHDSCRVRSALSWWHEVVSVVREDSKLRLRIIQSEEACKLKTSVMSPASVRKQASSKTLCLDTVKYDGKASKEVRLLFVQHQGRLEKSPEQTQRSEKCTNKAGKHDSCYKCNRHQLPASTAAKDGANLVIDANTYSGDYYELPPQMDDSRTSVVPHNSSDALAELQQVSCWAHLMRASRARLQFPEKFTGVHEDCEELSRRSNNQEASSALVFNAGVNSSCENQIERRIRAMVSRFRVLKLTAGHSKPLTLEQSFLKKDRRRDGWELFSANLQQYIQSTP